MNRGRVKERTISTYPHLKKFIYKFYDIHKDEPVRITMRSSMGIAMKHALKEKKKVHPKEIERMRAHMNVVISSHRLADMELRLSILHNWNLEYDRIFKEHLCTWVKAQFNAGINNRQGILNFLAEYNIKESEYSYDNAQRHWLRFKNKEYFDRSTEK